MLGKNLPPVVVQRKEFYVAGVSVTTKNRDESNPATGKIPSLWVRFYSEGIAGKLAKYSKKNSEIFGVYSHYQSDFNGDYKLTVACETESSEVDVPGLTVMTIPAQKYLMFKAVGEIPQSVVEVWQQIWQHFSSSSEEQRAYQFDFERYGSAEGCVEVYISVK